MKNNLFVAYDLMSPGHNYGAIKEKIESLGPSYKFQFSLYWLNTELSANEAYDEIFKVLDSSDKLAVIEAEGGTVSIIDNPPITAINQVWFRD